MELGEAALVADDSGRRRVWEAMLSMCVREWLWCVVCGWVV